VEDESFSDDFAGALENKNDSEGKINFLELVVAVGPVSWAIDALIVVLEAQHD
jgi:hypothetical protein